jgi:hypothetical protein
MTNHPNRAPQELPVGVELRDVLPLGRRAEDAFPGHEAPFMMRSRVAAAVRSALAAAAA